MPYLVALIVVVLLFLGLHYFTELRHKQKLLATALFASVVLGAALYNSYTDTQREKMLGVIAKFNQGQNIKCNATDINNTNFSLSVGTYTFIGKRDTSYAGQMFSASKCD